MRENCTYGSMRGRAYPITRGVPLYSTPFSVPNAGQIPLAADWKTFEVFWTLPADAVSADFSFFGWRDATLDFEVADFKLINE